MELVCPAGNLPALKRAVDEGADAVYFGFQNITNARQFAGLNFTASRAREGIDYAHSHGRRVLCAINTYPQPAGFQQWTQAVDQAAITACPRSAVSSSASAIPRGLPCAPRSLANCSRSMAFRRSPAPATTCVARSAPCGAWASP